MDRSGRGSREVTHLRYAVDTLVFSDAEELKLLRVFMVLFEGMSRLHINWRKSFLYPINGVYEYGGFECKLR